MLHFGLFVYLLTIVVTARAVGLANRGADCHIPAKYGSSQDITDAPVHQLLDDKPITHLDYNFTLKATEPSSPHDPMYIGFTNTSGGQLHQLEFLDEQIPPTAFSLRAGQIFEATSRRSLQAIIVMHFHDHVIRHVMLDNGEDSPPSETISAQAIICDELRGKLYIDTESK